MQIPGTRIFAATISRFFSDGDTKPDSIGSKLTIKAKIEFEIDCQ